MCNLLGNQSGSLGYRLPITLKQVPSNASTETEARMQNPHATVCNPLTTTPHKEALDQAYESAKLCNVIAED